MSCLHSPEWWRRHWERTGIVHVDVADSLTDGWKYWIEWQRVVAPDNSIEMDAVEEDAGRFLGYVRVVGRRNIETELYPPIESLPAEYSPAQLLREQ